MGKKSLILILLFLILSFTICFITFLSQELMGMEVIARGKRLPAEKVTFWVSEPGFKTVIPNLSFCWVYGEVKSYLDGSITLAPYDDNKSLGFMIFYNPKDNNIYAYDIVEKRGVSEEGEVIYKGKPHHYWLKHNYYYIGKGNLGNGGYNIISGTIWTSDGHKVIKKAVFKPSFIEGTWFSLRKRSPHPLAYDEHIKIHIPGDLKPTFTSYLIELDGERREVILDKDEDKPPK